MVRYYSSSANIDIEDLVQEVFHLLPSGHVAILGANIHFFFIYFYSEPSQKPDKGGFSPYHANLVKFYLLVSPFN